MLKQSALALGLLLAACQPILQGEPEARSPALASAGSTDGRYGQGRPVSDIAFAEAACAGCHAIRPLELSPNPDAPSFTDIANRQGLTAQTLSAFLRDAHNYPEVMDFDLDPTRADALAAYILTLRDASYKRPSY
jgi:mono/diheme cytochrome c family protein